MWNDRPIPPRTGTDSLAQKATAKKKKKREETTFNTGTVFIRKLNQ